MYENFRKCHARGTVIQILIQMPINDFLNIISIAKDQINEKRFTF